MSRSVAAMPETFAAAVDRARSASVPVSPAPPSAEISVLPTSPAITISPRLPQPDFELDITDVSPQLPISHFPLTISFVLRNNTQHAVTGYVDASFIQERYRVNNLAPGTVLNGSLTGTVTAQAGRGQTLQLSFSKDDNTEFPNKSATSYGLGYDIAARFMFRIENIQSVQIRSCGVIVAGFDTDYVYFVVKVGDQEHPVPEFRYKFVGKAFGGTNDIIPVDMQTDWIDVVPGYGTPVAIAYNVLNHGAQWLQLGKKIEDEISYAAKAALDAILPADKDTWDQLDKFTQWLNAFKFAGQDGSCVSDLIDRADESTLLTMDVIAQRTETTGKYTETRSYPQKYISPDSRFSWTCAAI